MVQAKKKKKNADFQKVKLKVGKKLVRSHITQPKVRAQQLVLKPQFDVKHIHEHKNIFNILQTPNSKDENVRAKNLGAAINFIEHHNLEEEVKIKYVVDILLKMLTYENNPVQHKIFQIIHLCLNKNALQDIQKCFKWKVVVDRLILQLSHLTSCSHEMHIQSLSYIKLVLEFYENYVGQLYLYKTNIEMKFFLISQINDVSKMVETLLSSLHNNFKWPILQEIGSDIQKRDIKLFKHKVLHYKTMHQEKYVDFANNLSCLPLVKKIALNFNLVDTFGIKQLLSDKWDEGSSLYNNVLNSIVSTECIGNVEKITHLIINYISALWMIETENFLKSNFDSNQTTETLISCLELFINYAKVFQTNKKVSSKYKIQTYISLALNQFEEKCLNNIMKNSNKVPNDKVNKMMSLFWNLAILMSRFNSENTIIDKNNESNQCIINKILCKINANQIAKLDVQDVNEILLNMEESNMTEKLIEIYDNFIPTIFNTNYVFDNKTASNIILIDGLFSILTKLFLKHVTTKLAIAPYIIKITNWICLIFYPLLTTDQSKIVNLELYTESLFKLICVMRTHDEDFITNFCKLVTNNMPQNTPQHIFKLLHNFLSHLPIDNIYSKQFNYFITIDYFKIC